MAPQASLLCCGAPGYAAHWTLGPPPPAGLRRTLIETPRNFSAHGLPCDGQRRRPGLAEKPCSSSPHNVRKSGSAGTRSGFSSNEPQPTTRSGHSAKNRQHSVFSHAALRGAVCQASADSGSSLALRRSPSYNVTEGRLAGVQHGAATEASSAVARGRAADSAHSTDLSTETPLLYQNPGKLQHPEAAILRRRVRAGAGDNSAPDADSPSGVRGRSSSTVTRSEAESSSDRASSPQNGVAGAQSTGTLQRRRAGQSTDSPWPVGPRESMAGAAPSTGHASRLSARMAVKTETGPGQSSRVAGSETVVGSPSTPPMPAAAAQRVFVPKKVSTRDCGPGEEPARLEEKRPSAAAGAEPSADNDTKQLVSLFKAAAGAETRDPAPGSEAAEAMPSNAGKLKKQALKTTASGPDSFRCDPSSLLPGDHLVHMKLGVCRFIGTRSEVPLGRDKPVKYLLLKFADGTAKLSSKQAKQVLYRYGLAGSPGRPPTLSKLNDTAGWEKKKSKGEAAVRKMVMEMMELYVHRLRQRRPVYRRFTPEMEEFAASFPYKPTEDQLQAFEDIERDMTERETPMDRLICGDVGFGKTEVALRAVFRAVLDGRQVMMLAPTTVLAKQHYKVIATRFAKYPHIQVGLLSRFQKEGERREILEKIKDGSMHIVAGTHSLLGAQVVYHNLGLLVIDEEQRFGVRQKERISSLKTTVDLLTLSATPIPRTLYMSLHGFRDASRIATPPPERKPINTHVLEHSRQAALGAIKRELDRGGQVFYVRPRVEGMHGFLSTLRLSLPGVTMDLAHGQMKSAELEEVMERFTSGQVQLLLCTTIIESGIDIRSANTIIIEDAHLFGLAQIYQLRGRVGRSNVDAHAYLLHPRQDLLSSEAQERLAALKTYGGLGQGYELAQRDMDIRGIGDVFGERQSGDVGGVGYYLFMEMLHNTLNKVEQESLPRVHFDDVRLDIAASFEQIPANYVPIAAVRERLQKEAEGAAKQGMQPLLQFCNRMRKEFGEEPPEMEMTLKVLFLKRIATDLGIERIFVRNGTSTVLLATAIKLPAFQKLKDAIIDEELKNSLQFHAGGIELVCKYELSESDILNRTLACLGQMRNALPSFVNFL